jgi:alkanesulfonate monooxygenase SsuD/methylene tetrahydromethanopterin reductase-like flavin-dependent oxidoreductase (luciferase family)
MTTLPRIESLGRFTETGRPMQVGLFLPLTRRFGLTADPTFAQIKHLALYAEELGFDSLWFGDHFIDPDSGDGERSGWWEMWTILTALAAVTERVQIGAFVNCVLFRNPGITAKQAEAVDEVSGGRFTLGLGAGWNEADFSAFGLPFDKRVSRFKEGLGIISSLLRTGAAEFQGTYYQAKNAINAPRGPRGAEGGPPIMIGGQGPRMLDLVARYADIWDSDFVSGPAVLAPMLGKVDQACLIAGRDPATLIRSSAIHCEFAGAVGHWDIATPGTPDAIAEQIVGIRELGVRQLVVSFDPGTPASLETIARAIELAG